LLLSSYVFVISQIKKVIQHQKVYLAENDASNKCEKEAHIYR